MNVEADLKDQAKNKRLFEETLTIMKKAWTEKFFSHQGRILYLSLHLILSGNMI